MARSASEELQQRKQQKFERELTRALSSVSSKDLKAYVSERFKFHDNKPSADHFLKMTLASKFGTGNSIAEGGVGFLLETTMMVFNEVHRGGRLDDNEVLPWGTVLSSMCDTGATWNAVFIFEIEASFLPHLTEFEASEFVWEDEVSPYLFLDKETRAFGFVIVPLPPMTLDDLKEYGRSELKDWDTVVEDRFRRMGYAQSEVLGFGTGQMEFISAVKVLFGPVDKLVGSLPDRKRHDVSSHERNLASGRVTTVRAYKRKTPLRLAVNNRVLTDHIVYRVKDYNDEVRYYGEGTKDRPKHVNSGVSHNFKINEHFFTKGEMTVEVLHDGLTKSEALSIEKMLIRRGAKKPLWNVKDYEPSSMPSDRQISMEEIESYTTDQ